MGRVYFGSKSPLRAQARLSFTGLTAGARAAEGAI